MLVGAAFVHDIGEDEITEINKFVEFNHSELEFECGILPPFPRVFTPNVKTVTFANGGREHTECDDFDIDTVLQHLPNVVKVEFYGFEMSKLFVKINRDFGPKVAEMHFHSRSKAEIYYLLAEIMRKQSSNVCFYVHFRYEQRDDQNLLLYFKPVAKLVPNHVGSIYYVLRDLPGFSDSVLNANHSIPAIQSNSVSTALSTANPTMVLC
uniref:Uncharacterized protein n=1 Tax=Panagrolaimus sp. JU765 TaxID=591449 RepID=A0AC34RP25_9BILA